MKSVKALIIIIIILLIALAASVTLVVRTAVFSGKATSTNSSPIALENSYLFASPLQAKADGKELIRVTVFILDGRGLGVSGKPVILDSSPSSVNIAPIQPTTDDTGKAVFDVSSSTAQKYKLSASVNGQPLPQKVSLSFY